MLARNVPLFLAAALALLLSREALAQSAPDPATRQVARKVAEEGLKLYSAGDFKGALEKFNLADSLVPAPTLGIQAARCLVKLGRLVEASERYLEVMRVKLDKNALFVHKKAQVDALKERDELMARIPTVEIRIEGPLGDNGKVMIDDSEVPAALFGQKRPVDPGKHTIVAKRPDTLVKREVTVGERETTLAVLKLPPLPAAEVKLVRNPAGETQRLAGWIALGVGAGGLIAGGVNGVIALAMQGSLKEKCPMNQCGPNQYDNVDAFTRETTASTVGFIIGAVGAAAGVTLLLTAPPALKPAPEKTERALRVWVGPSGAFLRGEF